MPGVTAHRRAGSVNAPTTMSAPDLTTASRKEAGMLLADDSMSPSQKQMYSVVQAPIAAAIARPLPPGATITSAPSSAARSRESSSEPLSTNQTRSFGPAA